MLVKKEIKKNIRGYDKDELKEIFVEYGEKPFRAQQVYQWIWQKSVNSFADMTNLSKEFRQFLDDKFVFHRLETITAQKSSDRTIKSAFRLFDDKIVEGVLIPAGDRMTACVSSQAGCSLDCKFCATARLKLLRNLTADEIYDQVATIWKQAESNYQRPLSNIVYMGMSPRRITVSTSGVAKMIQKLGEDEVKFNLALSLHVANNEKRSKMMSINDSNPLEMLAGALKFFYSKTGTRVTYEYIIFKDFNDSIEDAKELADFCKHIPCKVNIIEYNPIDDGIYQQAPEHKVNAFVNYLENRNIIVNIRRSRGKDIDAACGQLANKV